MALVAVLALLIATGWYLVWPLIMAVSALLYLRLRGWRTRLS